MVEIGIAHALGKPILLAHHPQTFGLLVLSQTAPAVVCAENRFKSGDAAQRAGSVADDLPRAALACIARGWYVLPMDA